MKKSINITLNGLVFSLEEDAYEELKRYLDSIESHYQSPEEKREIMADIEAGIAEKFNEKIKTAKQAVTLADVQEVISIMGTVEEITDSAGQDAGDRPEEDDDGPLFRKRLYRNTDDVVIAGVASGLAAYLGIDPVFVRLIFIVLTFLNGLGLLIYIILWMAMPKATSNAQKLKMRGQPVNLAGLQRTVKEKTKMISEEGREVMERWHQKTAWRKALHLPVKVVEAVFIVVKNIFKVAWLIMRILFGSMLLLGSVLGLIAVSVISSLLVFNINSPYLTSDFPLQELASNPTYYIAVIAFYASTAIVLIFLSGLAIIVLRKKNTLRLVPCSILAGLWMLCTVAFLVAAVNLVPLVKTKVAEINQQEIITKNFDYQDFHKLYLSGQQNVRITPGDTYAIKLSGRPADLDRLVFALEDGQLQITQKERQTEGLCIFCLNHDISGEIVVPRLDSYVGVGHATAEIKGFDQDLYVSLGETADAKIQLAGQNLRGQLSGVGSRLELSGVGQTIDLVMNGSADFYTEDLQAGKIKLDLSVFSQANLSGITRELEAAVQGNSQLAAYNLAADQAKIEASDFAEASLWTKNKLEVTSRNNATVSYRGQPAEVIKYTSGNSSLESEEGEVWQHDQIENCWQDCQQD